MRGREGFALIAAVIVVASGSALLLGLTLEWRHHRTVIVSMEDGPHAWAASRAGLAHALALLADSSESARHVAGAPHSHLSPVRLPSGASYAVEIRDVNARLNVNGATEEELTRLFVELGSTFEAAQEAAHSILDWIDADDLRRARGAEWPDHYSALEWPVRPRNGPALEVGELRYVRGMTSDLYARAAGMITVRGSGRINVNSAPIELLRSIPQLPPDAVRLIASRREGARPLGSLLELEASLPAGARARLLEEFPALVERVRFESDEFEIVSEGTGRSSAKRVLEVLAVRKGWELHVVEGGLH